MTTFSELLRQSFRRIFLSFGEPIIFIDPDRCMGPDDDADELLSSIERTGFDAAGPGESIHQVMAHVRTVISDLSYATNTLARGKSIQRVVISEPDAPYGKDH